ncbi:MAG: NADH-quinone oxidoreductase subunit J [Phycisphaerae bacterium]
MIEALCFYLFATVAIVSCAAIVLTRNIVRAAVWLFGVLVCVAGLFGLLNAPFLMAMQLIVYAGGILILIVFGVMLTAKSPAIRYQPRGREIVLAALATGVLLVGLLRVMLAGAWPALGTVQESVNMDALGQALMTRYLVPFELISALLLAVMIAAAYLARPVRKS